MSTLDWFILFGTLACIVAYGVWKSRGAKNMETFIRGNKQKWWMMGISIMATQASAVTFLSTTGQGMEDGMRFVQFYFGLPLAMIILSFTLLPIYYKLKVFTAYEYLESRFDVKTRILAAIFFFALRGLSVGITLFAPSLVLSTILGWNTFFTTLLIGLLVVIYTVAGGNTAVSVTQRIQMSIILVGMFVAGAIAFFLLPSKVSFSDAVQVANELNKLQIINTHFSWNDRYNIWSGLFASTFLFLSYFGADQSQVSRYIGGKSLAEGRLGLLFNGLFKIPFQFFILFIGVLVFIFYLFHTPPMVHNAVLLNQAKQSEAFSEIDRLEKKFIQIREEQKQSAFNLVDAIHAHDQPAINEAKQNYFASKKQEDSVRALAKDAMAKTTPVKGQDRDYIFLNFVLTYLPHGLIGLLLAVIFSAAMSSMSSELSALATTTLIDIYKRLIGGKWKINELLLSKILIVFWACVAVAFATLASFAENLIQFVNIVGSLFYGTLLGIFVVAFYLKRIQGTAVFWSAIIAETAVLVCYQFFYDQLAFLYYNIIGCIIVLVASPVMQFFISLGQNKPLSTD